MDEFEKNYYNPYAEEEMFGDQVMMADYENDDDSNLEPLKQEERQKYIKELYLQASRFTENAGTLVKFLEELYTIDLLFNFHPEEIAIAGNIFFDKLQLEETKKSTVFNIEMFKKDLEKLTKKSPTINHMLVFIYLQNIINTINIKRKN